MCQYIHSLLLDFRAEMCYQRTVGLYFLKCEQKDIMPTGMSKNRIYIGTRVFFSTS